MAIDRKYQGWPGILALNNAKYCKDVQGPDRKKHENQEPDWTFKKQTELNQEPNWIFKTEPGF